jgi:hypothetical protein
LASLADNQTSDGGNRYFLISLSLSPVCLL